MEQTTQQTIQKPPLPIKTKIAAWWMVILGGIAIVLFLIVLGLLLQLLFHPPQMPEFGAGLLVLIVFYFLFCALLLLFPGIFLFLPALFLLKRKRWAWKFAVISLLIGMVILACFLFGSYIKETSHYRESFKSGEIIAERKIPLIPIPPFLKITPFIIFLIPFLLLLLDRKNFWKIAT